MHAEQCRRVEDLRQRVPAVSARALFAVVRDIAQYGLPVAYSRSDIRSARNSVCDAATPHRRAVQHLPLHGLPAPGIEIAHPAALLWYLFAHCEGWRRLLLSRHSAVPSSETAPWHMILYTDEVTPGNVIGVQPRRKSQCMYVSFFELGAAALAREDAWLTIAICWSTTVKLTAGGIA